MALLIASELFTLLFAMEILSAVRSFVGGEGLWSKAQKDAVHALHRYAFTQDPKFYADFHKQLEISHGDRAARIEMEKPTFDMQVVIDGFGRGGIKAEDVPGLVKLIRRFYWVSYIRDALVIWRQADEGINELEAAGERLHKALSDPNSPRANVNRALTEIDELNERLTLLEVNFSETLSAGSRWLEYVLMIALLLAVLTVESTGLYLTISFSRTLSRSLNELTTAAAKIGRGNFDVHVPVRSRDELGQLAESINKMSVDLKNSTGDRIRAESASESKSQFLANMSHEIRTPLGVILGLTEILKDSRLDYQEQRRYVETIEKTGKNLTRIINDILDLSKVEAGHLEIERTRFKFADFINELYTMLNVQAVKAGNELVFKSNGPLPQEITTDRTRLRQILVNIIGNALKFTKDGKVTLSYGVRINDLVFDVIDNGAGIENEGRERLFDAFVRTDGAVGTRSEGTGLGLMLSRQLARALGGDVNLVRSELGVGTHFRTSINLTEVSETSEKRIEVAPRPEEILEGRRVLVVEDSEDNQLLVKLYLERKKMIIAFADNGQEGLDRVNDANFDLVLMDMQMPVMDGYRATSELRNSGFIKPIIALTAHAMKEDRERCLKAGCTDYLTKPIDSALLYTTMARHLNVNRSGGTYEPQA